MAPMPPASEWLTTAEAAALTRFSAAELRRLARCNYFEPGTATKPTGAARSTYRWNREALERWLSSTVGAASERLAGARAQLEAKRVRGYGTMNPELFRELERRNRGKPSR